ncbi:unnamed protein product [Prunus armeniaca]
MGEECTGSAVRSMHWPLGVKSKQILDIDTSLLSDVNDIEEFAGFKMGKREKDHLNRILLDQCIHCSDQRPLRREAISDNKFMFVNL